MSSKPPAVIRDRDHAFEVAKRYIETGQEDGFVPYLEGMMVPEAKRAFEAVESSGREMTRFEQFVSLVRINGLMTREEAVELIAEASLSGRNPSMG